MRQESEGCRRSLGSRRQTLRRLSKQDRDRQELRGKQLSDYSQNNVLRNFNDPDGVLALPTALAIGPQLNWVSKEEQHWGDSPGSPGDCSLGTYPVSRDWTIP